MLWMIYGKQRSIVKISFFWYLILNRILIRVDFTKHEVLVSVHKLICSLRFSEEEDSEHLFYSCSISNPIWIETCDWLEMDLANHTCDWFKIVQIW